MRERGLSAPIWTGGDIHRQHPKGICTGRAGVGDGKCADSLRDRGRVCGELLWAAGSRNPKNPAT